MRLLIVEDHAIFREAVAKACREFGHEIVGETDGAETGYDLCTRFEPDVLILDLGLEDQDGFWLVSRLETERNPPKVLIVSCYCDDYTFTHVDHNLIFGFVDKGVSSLSCIGDALAEIARGRTYFSRGFRVAKAKRDRDILALKSLLTAWEAMMLSLIGSGLSDSEISTRVHISPRTVQGHRSLLMKKLGVNGTPQLMTFAIAHGYSIPHGIQIRPRSYETWLQRITRHPQMPEASPHRAISHDNHLS